MSKKFILIVMLGMIYATLYMTCTIMFFRYTAININFLNYHAKFSCSPILYPCMFITSDLIVMLSNRKVGITIALLGLFCEGMFALNFGIASNASATYFVSNSMRYSSMMIDHLGKEILPFFCYGIVAETLAAIGEIILFSSIFNRIKKFTVSTIVSITITFIIHNTIKDYAALSHEPDVWKIIMNNTFIDISIMTIYVFIVSFFIKMNGYFKVYKCDFVTK